VLEQVNPEVSKAAADSSESPDRVARLLSAARLQELAHAAMKSDAKSPTTGPAESKVSLAPLPADLIEENALASTTHLLVIDRFGNIGCVTQSLGFHFGCGVMAPGTGFLLNNDMNNFGYSNSKAINYVAPGKWPTSTIGPTIVMDEKTGKPRLVIGAPGGARIPSAILQVMIDVLDFQRPLDEAILAPRFHIRRQNKSFAVDFEKTIDPKVEAEMKTRGWLTEQHDDKEFYFGAVNAALFMPDGTIFGVADQRRTSDAGGQ